MALQKKKIKKKPKSSLANLNFYAICTKMLLLLCKSSIIISEKSPGQSGSPKERKAKNMSTKIIADDTLSSQQNDANPSQTHVPQNVT